MLLDLRLRVFRHTQRLSLEFHESYTSGRIISRQTCDLEALRELLDSGISSLASGALYMAVHGRQHLRCWTGAPGCCCWPPFVPMFLLTRWYQKRSQLAYRASRVASAKLIVHFVETMTGIRAVKAFRREKVNAAKYDELAEDYRGATVRSINLYGIFQPGPGADRQRHGGRGAAGRRLPGARRRPGGGCAAGPAAVRQALLPAGGPDGHVLQLLPVRLAALEKVSGLLEEVPTVRPPKHPVDLQHAAGDIRFDGVEFRYGDGPVILPRLDLHIPAGQTVALVGQTGAGKSTLAKLIARFYDPSDGSVLLDGVDLREPHAAGPAPRHRHGDAGGVPVQRLGGGQHRPGQARGHAARRSRPRRGRWARTSSSRPCPTATTPT